MSVLFFSAVAFPVPQAAACSMTVILAVVPSKNVSKYWMRCAISRMCSSSDCAKSDYGHSIQPFSPPPRKKPHCGVFLGPNMHARDRQSGLCLQEEQDNQEREQSLRVTSARLPSTVVLLPLLAVIACASEHFHKARASNTHTHCSEVQKIA